MDQDELTMQAVENLRASRRPAAPSQIAPRSTAMAAPALLGLLLRGSLIAPEKESLDNLMPGNQLIFLVHGDKWIHPEDVPLFDFGEISGAVSLMGPAIVTHRYRSRHSSETFSICTAILNPEDENPIILGLFGPADHRTDHHRNDFGCQVRHLRGLLPRIQGLAQRLLEQLNIADPALVVDQANGTVMAANAPAENLFAQSKITPIGAQYSELVSSTRLHTACSLGVQHLEGNGNGLAVMMLQPVAFGNKTPMAESPEKMIEGLNAALAEMTGAVRSLGLRKHKSCDGVTVSLLHSLSRHAEAISDRVDSLKSIVMGQSAHSFEKDLIL